MGQESKDSSATMASWIGRKERNWQRRQSGRLLIFSICEKLNLTIDDPIMCLQENQLFFPFSIFKSSSKSVSFFVIEVPNLRCFSLKAYPQNFSDFASPSLSKSIIVENFQICMCFFFSFFALQIVKIK